MTLDEEIKLVDRMIRINPDAEIVDFLRVKEKIQAAAPKTNFDLSKPEDRKLYEKLAR